MTSGLYPCAPRQGITVLLLTLALTSPGMLEAQAEMPSAAEVREALQTLRRLERALVQQPCAARSRIPAEPVDRNERTSGTEFENCRPRDDEPLKFGAPRTTESPQAVVTPNSFSISLQGGLDLGGFLFKEGDPFLHNDGGSAARNTALGSNALISSTPGQPSGVSGDQQHGHWVLGPTQQYDGVFQYGVRLPRT